jgi:hypothetical protein
MDRLLVAVRPQALIFGHTFRMSQCDSQPTLCVGSLSVDGIVSLSVEDLTIALHHPTLFSENSQCLIAHAASNRLIIAVQMPLVHLLSRTPRVNAQRVLHWLELVGLHFDLRCDPLPDRAHVLAVPPGGGRLPVCRRCCSGGRPSWEVTCSSSRISHISECPLFSGQTRTKI